MTSPNPRISVIIPVHNAARHIEITCNRILTQLESYPLQLILVENGSTDNSFNLITALRRLNHGHSNTEIIVLQSQVGLGNALFMGARVSSGEIIWVTGDDLPFGTNDLLNALPQLERDTIVVGSKLHPDSRVERRLLRSLMTKLFWCARFLILNSKVLDTQGTLIAEGELFRRLSVECQESGWLFTTEILFKAESIGIRIQEIPVELERVIDRKSNIKFWDPFRMFMGLLRIRYRSIKRERPYA